jgi:hypothetical protein
MLVTLTLQHLHRPRRLYSEGIFSCRLRVVVVVQSFISRKHINDVDLASPQESRQARPPRHVFFLHTSAYLYITHTIYNNEVLHRSLVRLPFPDPLPRPLQVESMAELRVAHHRTATSISGSLERTGNDTLVSSTHTGSDPRESTSPRLNYPDLEPGRPRIRTTWDRFLRRGKKKVGVIQSIKHIYGCSCTFVPPMKLNI